jgi:AraC-like DNA-binding protein
MEPVSPAPDPGLCAALPHPALRPYVGRYLQSEFDLPPGATLRTPLCATPFPVLTLRWSGEVEAAAGPGCCAFRVPPLVLAGPITAAGTNTFRGAMRGFFVRFAPLGALALFGVWGGGVPDSVCDPAEAARPGLGPAFGAWADEVVSAPDFPSRAAATDRFLLACLMSAPPRTGPVQPAVDLAERSSGTLRVGEVATRLGVGESTLRRRFAEETGLSAKLFAQIVRFRHAHAYLRTTPGARWPDAVIRFGYVDQAHLTRAYTRFTGAPPTRWRAGEHFLDLGMGMEEEGRGERFVQAPPAPVG